MKTRCFGNKPNQTLYAEYHDHEWGVPVHEDQHLLEMLTLEGAQAGLSWETVLKKREAYRKAFHHFDPRKVAVMSDEQLEKLCVNPSIIRNRLKIFSARQNALVFLAIQKEFGSFDAYVWRFVNHVSLGHRCNTLAELPTTTSESDALSKDLQKRGMKFVGPTIIYAFMQAVGMINDHLRGCFKYNESEWQQEGRGRVKKTYKNCCVFNPRGHQ